jgi:hypothetical protein
MILKKITPIMTASFLTLLFINISGAFTYNSLGERNLVDSTLNDTTKAVYSCPMHPEVTSDKAGTCPKCGMNLELKKEEKKDQGMNCPDMELCNQSGCNMEQCKGHSAGCTDKCTMMMQNKPDNSKEHENKSGCMGH